ncbi:MAG: hypothetical protein C4524_06060 [Candidatus Zixiibacteriota bacterium]|nr:MAG: hypothetical protein C4524_06060 [candidate division Zixibacteria bacterium]
MRTRWWLPAALVLALSAQAFNYTDQQLGGRLDALDARTAALGGAVLEDAPEALTVNPALMALGGRSFSAQGGVSLYLQREGRARPTFDTFEEITYYNEYVLNEETYGRVFAAARARLPQPLLPGLTVGLGWLPRSSRDYAYTEEVRGIWSNGGLSDQVLGYNTLETSGGTQALALAAACQPLPGWAAGLSLAALFGRSEHTSRTDYLDPDDPDAYSGWIEKYDGLPLDLNLGLAWNWKDRLTLGLGGEFPLGKRTVNLEDRSAGTTLQFEETSPPAATLNGCYRPVNFVRTVVAFDARMEFWSQYERTGLTNELRDVLTLGAGVEHRVLPEVPLRLGFRYRPSPSDPDPSRTDFGFGTGFDLLSGPSGSLQLDLAGQIGTRTYYQTDLFPESLFGGNNYAGEDRVQERSFKAFATVTYTR